MEASKLVHKISKFINYANLCKFTEPRKGSGGAISYNVFFIYFFFLLLLFFFFSFHAPSGASNFYFLTSRKLYHMKFVIFDVARCRMSATSLTFWFVVALIEIFIKLNVKC